jgi:hypothetical protein
MSGAIVAIVALGSIVLGGLWLIWLIGRRRGARDDRDPGPRLGTASSGEPTYPGLSSPGDATTGFEDPLVAAMGRASDPRSGGASWKIVDPSLVSGGSDEPRWVRRLDPRMPVLPAAGRLDRDLPTYEGGVDSELG